MSDDRPSAAVSRRQVLRTSATVVATGVGLSAASGTALAGEHGDESSGAACFPSKLTVEVKPGNGDSRDPINPNRDGVIPVAVMQTEDFDPTARPVNYRFDAAGKVGCDSARPVHGGHVEDVDGDGDADLVLHFDASATTFERGDKQAELLWVDSEDDGQGHGRCSCHGLSGTDDVKVVGKR